MAKFNWDRFRVENRATRGGSEYIRSEREIYYPKREKPPSRPVSSHAERQTPPPSPSAKTKTRPHMLITRPRCGGGVKNGRQDKHVKRAQDKAESAAAAPPAPEKITHAPLTREVVEQPHLGPAAGFFQHTPFTDVALRDWFFDLYIPDMLPVEGVATIGSSPFDKGELDEFFRGRGLRVYVADGTAELLVVGRRGWSAQGLEALVDSRAGKALRVYSQEMFLAYLGGGSDPLEDEAVARSFGAGHPALEFLASVGFDWPTTVVRTSGDGDFIAALPQVGLLSYHGYAVGKNGLDDWQRREVLRYVFNSELRDIVVSRLYMEEWGRPKSKRRLQKMANSIATFCRNAKKNSADTALAVSDWEGDLDWLKKTFYTGRFRFQWPSTSAR